LPPKLPHVVMAQVFERFFGRLFLSDHILTIQAEPPGVDLFDISFFAATVTARNFCVPHLCPLILITASFMSPPHTPSSLKSVTYPCALSLRVKAVVHLDQNNAPIASASLANNGSVHAIAINALTVFDVVHAYSPLVISALVAHYRRIGKAAKAVKSN
jgi:hypothetical protein